MQEHEGWRVFNITTPDGVNFNMGYKDGTLRIRKAGVGEYWQPVDITVDPETITTIKIHYDTFVGDGAQKNTYKTVPGKHVDVEDKEEPS